MSLLIVGCGGHAKDVLACVTASFHEFKEDVEFWSEVDGDKAPNGTTLRAPTRDDEVHIAIGDNRTRERLQLATVMLRMRWIMDVHCRDRGNAGFGHGSYAAAGSVLGARSRVGRGVIVNYNASIGHDAILGDFSHVAPLGNVCGRAEIGEGAFIGASAVVLPGVKVGAWAVVGAGAVVQRDVAPGATVYGNPARVMPGT